MNISAKIAVAILTGTIFVAKSPSSVIAVINELRAKGRFTKMAISVTVLLDVLVIILFTICLTIANNLINETDFNFSFIYSITIELIVIFLLGYLFSLLLKLLLSTNISNVLKSIALLTLGFAIYKLSEFIEFASIEYLNLELVIEPLLICIIASFILTNFSKYRDDLNRSCSVCGFFYFSWSYIIY